MFDINYMSSFETQTQIITARLWAHDKSALGITKIRCTRPFLWTWKVFFRILQSINSIHQFIWNSNHSFSGLILLHFVSIKNLISGIGFMYFVISKVCHNILVDFKIKLMRTISLVVLCASETHTCNYKYKCN